MQYKLCISDCGGVVIGNYQTLGRIARRFNLDLEALVAEYHIYDRPLMDGTVTTKMFWEHLAARFHRPSGYDPMVEEFHPIPIPQGITLIKEMKRRGMRVVCGSNTCAGHWEMMQAAGCLDLLFDKAYLSYEMHVSKPDPDFFRAILESEKVRPEETLFIDDVLENVEGARSIGIHAEQFISDIVWSDKDRILDLLDR